MPATGPTTSPTWPSTPEQRRELAEGADPQFSPGIRAADRLDITFAPGEREAATA